MYLFFSLDFLGLGRGRAVERSSGPDVLCEKGVLRNLPKFTGKYLCHSLFFDKVAGLAYSELESIEYSEAVAWKQWRIQRLPDAVYRRLNYVPKLKKTDAKQHQLFNHIFNANASTPSQTPFNLKSNVVEIVELKTLSIPVSATQFCLNVSQSIVCKKIEPLHITGVPKLVRHCAEEFCKKVVPKNSQNSQENTCVRVSFLIKLQTCNFI